MAMSHEIRPLALPAVLYPHPPYTIERSANAVGLSIPPPEINESGDRDRSPIKHFVWGGYNAARGLISREITTFML